MNIHYLELLNSVTQTGWVQESGRVSPEQNYREKSGHINSHNCSFKDANCAACTTTGAVLAAKFTTTWFYDSTETLKPTKPEKPSHWGYQLLDLTPTPFFFLRSIHIPYVVMVLLQKSQRTNSVSMVDRPIDVHIRLLTYLWCCWENSTITNLQ